MRPSYPECGAFTFDPEDHVYRVNGTILPSITQLLRIMVDVQYYTVEARDRGTLVHDMVDRFEKYGESEVEPAPEYRGYLDAWIRFVRDHSYLPIISEIPLYHPVLHYAGTPDKVGFVDGVPHIVEIKTGPPHPTYQLQTAAQLELVNHAPIELFPHVVRSVYRDDLPVVKSRILVVLCADGKYSIIRHTDPNDMNVFRGLLLVRRYMTKNQL